jgi:hypothetical protein
VAKPDHFRTYVCLYHRSLYLRRSAGRWVRFLEENGSEGWVLAKAVVGEETAAAVTEVDMAFGREVGARSLGIWGAGSPLS